jgi:hypothetical protein
MKHIFLALCLLGATIFAKAQSANYESAMTKQLDLLKQPDSFTPDKLLAIGNTFERIAAAEKTQWLPYYYAAYCQVMAALNTQDKSKVDAISDKAEQNIATADGLQPKNDEIYCIKSLIATSRIGVDPQTRGMKYGMEAASLLEQAKQINAENPRIYMLKGQSLFYTPEQFGGSKSKAKEMFELSLQKFTAFKPASTIAPQWGEEYTKQLLAQAK